MEKSMEKTMKEAAELIDAIAWGNPERHAEMSSNLQRAINDPDGSEAYLRILLCRAELCRVPAADVPHEERYWMRRLHVIDTRHKISKRGAPDTYEPRMRFCDWE